MIDIRDCKTYVENCLKIKAKNGSIIPFKMNAPQERLYNEIMQLKKNGIPARVIVLKARQMGFSTLIEAMMFHSAATDFHIQNFTVAHQEDSTKNLFIMAQRYYEELPPVLKPLLKTNNGNTMEFGVPNNAPPGTKGLDSAIRIATAGGRSIGRSYTFTNVHMSEYAFWPGNKLDTLLGIMQAVPNETGTMVCIESTANGFDNFKDLWDQAVEGWSRGERDGWMPFFAAWHEMPEYRRPADGLVRTEEEQELVDQFGLDNEQLAWRRWCIKVNCGGDIEKFKQEYPATPEEAFIASGTCIFNQAAIVAWIEVLRHEERKHGAFAFDPDMDNIEWADAADGEITILKAPEKGVPYVIGADTAGDSGGEWSDYFAAHVLDNRTGEQVAVLHAQMDEDEFARQLYCLGVFYNTALIAVEINFSTHPNKKLVEMKYPKLYVRERTDTFTGELKKTFGWRTDRITRPDIIAGLKEIARDNLDIIRDPDTLREMLSFALQNGRAEALPGQHDDLVMSLAIAHAVRGQQTTRAEKPEADKRKWTADMWEDYRNASRREKARLKEMWGEPER